MGLPLRIYTLGRFEIVKADGPLRFRGKLPRKPLALLKTIIAFGGRNVREERLIDALWPDAHSDAARYSLTSAIHRLRRLFARPEVLLRKDGRMSLNQELCWIDIWEVERLLDRVDAIPITHEGENVLRSEIVGLVRQAAELYRGPFLDGEADAPWTSALADQVRHRLLRQCVAVGEHWLASERWNEAAIWYEMGLSVDHCAEDICRRLMSTYHRLGRPAQILRVYRDCEEALASGFGIKPTTETYSLLKELIRAKISPGK